MARGERRSLRKGRSVFFGLAIVSSIAGSSVSVAASSTSDLVQQARDLEAAHEEDLAIRRYTEALELDPTCIPAYLGLADLRARRGDSREAERVYSVALEHVPQLYIALVRRARVRRVLGETREGDRDLERYLNHEEDLSEIKELAAWYGDEGRAPAQLAAWRRLYASALRLGADRTLVREARATVKALELLVGSADPVGSPAAQDAVRRGLARIARRGE
jgi:tetratricopeptide (TPR) repeat protein